MFLLNDIHVVLDETTYRNVNNDISKFLIEMQDGGQSANHYSQRRGAPKPNKDIAYGKRGEAIAAVGLNKYLGFPYLMPDFKIRRKHEKNWEADLPYSKVYPGFPSVHVKTCPGHSLAYGDYSWVFQLDDKLFEGSDDYCALVFVENLTAQDGVIKVLLPFSIIVNYMKMTRKPEYRDSKRAVYYQDLLNDKDIILGGKSCEVTTV